MKMTELNNYYVLKVAKKDGENQYLGSLYADGINRYESIDGAMKFPEKETPKQLGEYICWREKEYVSYRVIEVKTTMKEIEYE